MSGPSSDDASRVLVYEAAPPTNLVAVETNVPGALPGQVYIHVPRGSAVHVRGMELVRLVWRTLKITGADVP